MERLVLSVSAGNQTHLILFLEIKLALNVFLHMVHAAPDHRCGVRLKIKHFL